mmetsp:Transcript_28274/g.55347  ORF Transcript_28274/g.55347 Transcript_28274/m.55347 type:complete len:204 (-) Transcript_28274:1-612(-)
MSERVRTNIPLPPCSSILAEVAKNPATSPPHLSTLSALRTHPTTGERRKVSNVLVTKVKSQTAARMLRESPQANVRLPRPHGSVRQKRSTKRGNSTATTCKRPCAIPNLSPSPALAQSPIFTRRLKGTSCTVPSVRSQFWSQSTPEEVTDTQCLHRTTMASLKRASAFSLESIFPLLIILSLSPPYRAPLDEEASERDDKVNA